jgi:hypothetical protein
MTAFIDRVIRSWRTSTLGVAASGVIVYLFSSLGCRLPASWIEWGLTAGPAIAGLILKERLPPK